jgi:hypothetical protein
MDTYHEASNPVAVATLTGTDLADFGQQNLSLAVQSTSPITFAQYPHQHPVQGGELVMNPDAQLFELFLLALQSEATVSTIQGFLEYIKDLLSGKKPQDRSNAENLLLIRMVYENWKCLVWPTFRVPEVPRTHWKFYGNKHALKEENPACLVCKKVMPNRKRFISE